MKKVYILLVLLYLTTPLFSQIYSNGFPLSWEHNFNNTPESIVISNAHISSSFIQKEEISKYGGFQFAAAIPATINLINQGTLYETPTHNIWMIKISSPGAFSLNLIFSKFYIPEGGKLYIYSNKNEQLQGAFTSKNNKAYQRFATSPIPGDEIIIEYNQAKNMATQAQLILNQVNHDFTGIFAKDGFYGDSDDCHIDINCDEGNDWQTEKRAVCRMIINGTRLCSGVLVNNTAKNQTPYVLSANHCVNTQYSAENTVFLFNYESPHCDGPDGSSTQSISGADLIATKNNDSGYLDFTLMRLSETIPESYNPYFAGWDTRENTTTQSVGIHHPWGDVKKICIDTDAPVKNSYSVYDDDTFWQILEWDKGTTEGGSSGSPIFNQDHRIIGTLTGDDGDPNDCDNPVNDFYQMFSAAYNRYNQSDQQLKQWLDPLNQEVAYLDGFDPSNNMITDKIIITHWDSGQELAFYETNLGGYMAGNNVFQDQAKAEYFNYSEFANRNAVSGAYVAFAYATGDDDELIEMQILSEEAGYPKDILGSSWVTLSEIKRNADQQYTYYRFDPPVIIEGSAFLSLVLPQNQGDTVALMTVEEAEVNTAWELNYDNDWVPYTDDNLSWGINLAHLIAMEVGTYTANKSLTKVDQYINLYPNPANNKITIESQETPKEIKIYNCYGQLKMTLKNNLGKENVIAVNRLNQGLYAFEIYFDDQVITQKVLIK